MGSIGLEKKEQGVFIKYKNGYYTFQMTKDEWLVFEPINRNVLEKYNLHTTELIGATFEITYTESLGDLADKDFIIYRIENLKLIES